MRLSYERVDASRLCPGCFRRFLGNSFSCILLLIGDTMKETVRFYDENGKYRGWNYLNKVTFRQARSWLRSGNSLTVKTSSGISGFNSFSSTIRLLNTFHKGIK